MKNPTSIFFTFLLLVSCQYESPSLNELTADLEGIPGEETYSSSSFITAGDRVYSIGAQNGTFPEIGWHIDGEMGGVWDHPIKLLDGFGATITTDGKSTALRNAQFINYPLANKLLYELDKLELAVEQVQFVPDQKEGLVVEYTIRNTSDKDFQGALHFRFDVDLRPTWLGERSNMIDSEDQLVFRTEENVFVAKDSNNDWFCIVGSSESPTSYDKEKSEYKGNGTTGVLTFQMPVKAKQSNSISFYISGSYTSEQEALKTWDAIKKSGSSMFLDKKKRYQKIEEMSKLTTSDENFNTIFRWIKYNSDWFIREVPEVGRGIAAGYPDYPWWFGCDSEYALQGYMSVGQFKIVEENIQLLRDLSVKTNSNGRIIHEASTNGEVFNKGNVNETPQFASLVWNAYLWTGNSAILADNFELIQKGLEWISNVKDEDNNLLPEGAGMMEIHGLESEMIDVASYTQRGFEDASRIAAELNDKALANTYRQKAIQLKAIINEAFWAEDFKSYADFIGDDHETLKLIDDAIIRADTLDKPWAVEELKETRKYILDNPSEEARPFVLHHNWVVNTPMELKIADSAKAAMALETAKKFVNPFGVFVTGIDRDESAGKEFGSFKGSKQFSYTGAVMTLPTGVSAIAENNYGNPDQALDYLERMGRSFSFALPGSIYEVSPDYGMFAQAWNIYSYAVPVIQQFFGIQPFASEKRITIQPLMPKKWEFASLENVKIGSNDMSIHYRKEETGYSLSISSTEPEWDIEVLPRDGYELDKKEEINEQESEYLFTEK